MKRTPARVVLAALAAVVLALGVAELGVRVFRGPLGIERSALWDVRGWVCHGQSRYLPKAYVGWVFDPARPETNTSGFIGPELARERTSGVPRVACLGGSTTAGNVYHGYEGSYPGALAAVLGERLGRPVEVLNFGVAGWTSAESLVNWVLNAQDYRPDVVVIHHAINDVFPRLGAGFRSDYTHFSRPWIEERRSWPVRFLTRWSDLYALWQLRSHEFRLDEHVGVPHDHLTEELRPETAAAFRRNLATLGELVAARGGTPVYMTMPWNGEPRWADPVLVLGMQEHNALARALAEERGWPLLDLASRQPDLQPFFVDGVHLTPEGNRRKAELVADFLVEHGLVGR